MELRRLRYFVAVAEHLSFRRAAESLKTAQPSMSQQIRALEAELGVDLFERTKRRVRLTNAGVEFLVGVRRIIHDVDACAQRARDAQHGRRGQIDVGTNGMVMIDHLPRVVRAFRATYPDVSVRVTILRNPDLTDAVRNRRIELAFTTDDNPDDTLEICQLWVLPQCVVLPSDHPLAMRPAIALRDLREETLITHPRRGGGGANSVIAALCREQRFVPHATKEVPEIADYESLIGLVACGFGFTILPAPFEHTAPRSVVFKPIEGPARPLQISARWRTDETNPLIENFVTAARGTDLAGGLVGA
jgi:DNA-binding transcriptional LysR family regulator